MPGTSSTPDAITLLKEDHQQVKELFKQYHRLVEGEASDEEKEDVAGQICLALSVHARAEEELFYPAARDLLGEDEDLVDEATVEHTSAKELIAQIQSSSPSDPLYDAKVKVLGEYIDHHVKEEENEMFPKLKGNQSEMAALGSAISSRKEELLVEMAGGAVQAS